MSNNNLLRYNSNFMEGDSDENFTLKFDFVMVFPLMKDSTSKKLVYTPECKYYVANMLQAGLKIYSYLSVQGDELIVLIFCPDEKLKEFADLIDYPVLLDPEHTREILMRGDPEHEIAPVDITHNPSITPYSPYEYIYCKYENEMPEEVYYHYGGITLFPKMIRLKLINELLKAPYNLRRGAGIPISTMIVKKKITGFYPLHNKSRAVQLLKQQLSVATVPWRQPTDDIREYYGEKIALYNLFLGHYTEYILVPSIVGIAFQVVVWYTLDFSHPVLPFFAVVITVGAIFMLEGWKRKEATTAMKWGMSSYEDRELERPEFEGFEIKSYINGEDMIYFPPLEFRARVQFSFVLIASMMMLSCSVVGGIYFLRFSLQSSLGSTASIIASGLNTSQIIITNMIYSVLVRYLTNLENHRTDTSYQDSMIVKLFLFQFVNSYASFFFLAFIAQNLQKPDGADASFKGQCGYENCMYPLSLNLAIIFGTKLVVTNVVEIVKPYVLQKLKRRKETKGVENKTLTPAEEDYMLLPYDPMINNIQNYAETAIQFGFMVLFITALPIGCFFSMVNSYVKIRVDAYKMTHYYQRPIPDGAQDIGTWQDIFNIIAVAAVITNGALICFTMDVLTTMGWSAYGRTWIFIGFQWVLISLQFAAATAIPDVPEEVEIQTKRNEFINDKVILKIPDEEFEPEDIESMKGNGTRDASSTKESSGGGCFCCRTLKSKKEKKINPNGLVDPTVQSYPFNKVGSKWPEMLGV